jgi:hypothetical protein
VSTVRLVRNAPSTAIIGTPAPMAATPPAPTTCPIDTGNRVSNARIRSLCSHSRNLCRCLSVMIVGTSTKGIRMAMIGMTIGLMVTIPRE